METKPTRLGSIVLRPLCGRVCQGVAVFCALRLAVFGVFWRVFNLSRAAFHVFGSHHPLFCSSLAYSCADVVFMSEHFLRSPVSVRQECLCLGAFVLLDTLLAATLLVVLVECARPGTFIVRSAARGFLPQPVSPEGIWPPPPTQPPVD